MYELSREGSQPLYSLVSVKVGLGDVESDKKMDSIINLGSQVTAGKVHHL